MTVTAVSTSGPGDRDFSEYSGTEYPVTEYYVTVTAHRLWNTFHREHSGVGTCPVIGYLRACRRTPARPRGPHRRLARDEDSETWAGSSIDAADRRISESPGGTLRVTGRNKCA
jgi:hypothetical protein